MFSKPKRLIASIATATLLLAGAAYAATYTFPRSGNSPPTAAEMSAQMGGGTFTTSSGGSNVWSTGGGKLVRRAEFVANVNNNGNCAGGNNPNYVMTEQDMVNCRVVTSSLGAITDPWFTAGTANWTVVSGSATFSAIPAATWPNEASGAQYVSGTSVVEQTISPSPIAAGTSIVARAYFLLTSQSGDGTNTSDICGDTGTAATATGSATLEIVRASDGLVLIQQQATGGQISAGASAPTTDTYKVRIVLTNNTATYVTWATRGTGDTATCGSTTHTVTGTANATGVSVANS